MSKKLHFWDFWDWKGIQAVLILVTMVVGLILLFNGPKACMRLKERNLDAQTIATITGYHKNRTPSHGTVVSVNIEYMFRVDTTTYYGAEIIPDDASNRRFLNEVYNADSLKIPIKYASENPTKSLINIDSVEKR